MELSNEEKRNILKMRGESSDVNRIKQNEGLNAGFRGGEEEITKRKTKSSEKGGGRKEALKGDASSREREKKG